MIFIIIGCIVFWLGCGLLSAYLASYENDVYLLFFLFLLSLGLIALIAASIAVIPTIFNMPLVFKKRRKDNYYG